MQDVFRRDLEKVADRLCQQARDDRIRITLHQDDNMWLGYLEEYPDYMTQGETLDELKENLKDLFKDLYSFPDYFTLQIFKMRITLFEKTIIKSSVKRHFGGNADVYLFGSRVDDNKKGGDIDLYITTDLPTPEIIPEKISLLLEIERELGEQKIDVVINNHTRQKTIYEIAEKEGVRL